MGSGTCGCQGYDLTQGDDYKIVMTKLDYAEFYLRDFSEDVQRKVVEIVCSGVINFGEQAHVSGLVGLIVYRRGVGLSFLGVTVIGNA